MTLEWLHVVILWCQILNDGSPDRQREKDCRQYFMRCIDESPLDARSKCFYRPKQDPIKEEIVR
jgi:hypothetical protein